MQACPRAASAPLQLLDDPTDAAHWRGRVDERAALVAGRRRPQGLEHLACFDSGRLFRTVCHFAGDEAVFYGVSRASKLCRGALDGFPMRLDRVLPRPVSLRRLRLRGRGGEDPADPQWALRGVCIDVRVEPHPSLPFSFADLRGVGAKHLLVLALEGLDADAAALLGRALDACPRVRMLSASFGGELPDSELGCTRIVTTLHERLHRLDVFRTNLLQLPGAMQRFTARAWVAATFDARSSARAAACAVRALLESPPDAGATSARAGDPRGALPLLPPSADLQGSLDDARGAEEADTAALNALLEVCALHARRRHVPEPSAPQRVPTDHVLLLLCGLQLAMRTRPVVLGWLSGIFARVPARGDLASPWDRGDDDGFDDDDDDVDGASRDWSASSDEATTSDGEGDDDVRGGGHDVRRGDDGAGARERAHGHVPTPHVSWTDMQERQWRSLSVIVPPTLADALADAHAGASATSRSSRWTNSAPLLGKGLPSRKQSLHLQQLHAHQHQYHESDGGLAPLPEAPVSARGERADRRVPPLPRRLQGDDVTDALLDQLWTAALARTGSAARMAATAADLCTRPVLAGGALLPAAALLLQSALRDARARADDGAAAAAARAVSCLCAADASAARRLARSGLAAFLAPCLCAFAGRELGAARAWDDGALLVASAVCEALAAVQCGGAGLAGVAPSLATMASAAEVRLLRDRGCRPAREALAAACSLAMDVVVTCARRGEPMCGQAGSLAHVLDASSRWLLHSRQDVLERGDDLAACAAQLFHAAPELVAALPDLVPAAARLAALAPDAHAHELAVFVAAAARENGALALDAAQLASDLLAEDDDDDAANDGDASEGGEEAGVAWVRDPAAYAATAAALLPALAACAPGAAAGGAQLARAFLTLVHGTALAVLLRFDAHRDWRAAEDARLCLVSVGRAFGPRLGPRERDHVAQASRLALEDALDVMCAHVPREGHMELVDRFQVVLEAFSCARTTR